MSFFKILQVAITMTFVLSKVTPALAIVMNGKIAFDSERDGNREIYVMNADGTGQKRLTNNPGSDFNASFSRDGSKITFETDRDGNFEIYVMNPDGTGQTRLTNTPAHENAPTFSPDGSKIAYAFFQNLSSQVYVMNADGTGQKRLTRVVTGVYDYAPSFSADGKKLAFDSDRDGNKEIYVMNADGSGQTNLTNTPTDEYIPAFSPDGSKIVYYSSPNNTGLDIYEMNADGSSQTNLTQSANSEYFPSFSPDGSKITYEAGSDIYIMDANGANQTRITNNPASDRKPSWGPAPALRVNNARTFYEGSASSPNSTTFTIKLSPASENAVTVNYTTTNATAKAGSDYVAKTGTLTFAPGETVKYVRVNFIGDNVAEANDVFYLDLITSSGAPVAVSRGSAYIRNDDGPSLTIDNAVTKDEGDSGTTPQAFEVRLSAASADTVTVRWATANGTAGPADYIVASGTLTFAPGETSKFITVQVKGDTTVEPNETYKVNLSSPTYAVLADSQGIAYIRNDDVSALSAETEPSK